MSGYDLDEKSGLMGLFGGIKSAGKVLQKGSTIDVKHYSMFNFFKAQVLEINENNIKIGTEGKIVDANFFPGDPLVINFVSSDEAYVIAGIIETIDVLEPLELLVNATKVEKLKDERKNHRYYVSLPCELKIAGIIENPFAVVKNISLCGIKLNCKVDIMKEEIIDLAIKLDKSTKLCFKGRVVRKNKIGDVFEYGIEIHEIAESNLRNLHHFINEFEYD